MQTATVSKVPLVKTPNMPRNQIVMAQPSSIRSLRIWPGLGLGGGTLATRQMEIGGRRCGESVVESDIHQCFA